MAVQQRRVSKTRCKQRKATHRYKGINTINCKRCGSPNLPHCVCKSCGYYKNRQVLSIET